MSKTIKIEPMTLAETIDAVRTVAALYEGKTLSPEAVGAIDGYCNRIAALTDAGPRPARLFSIEYDADGKERARFYIAPKAKP